MMLREKTQFRGVLTWQIRRLKLKFSEKYRIAQVDFWEKFRIFQVGELPLEPAVLEFQTLKLS